MKTRTTLIQGAAIAALLTAGVDRGVAEDKVPVPSWDYPEAADVKGMRTKKDLPGTFTRYYGQRRNQFNDKERRLAAIDLDADLNYDGAISDKDPADGGAFEQTPPGLLVGEGEMSKLIIRVRPYRVDYEGAAVVALEVTGINRGDKSGEFASFEEEAASTSQLRVWRDSSRTELLLDSSDPTRRYVEWSIEDQLYPANIPNIVPRTVYVEGIAARGSYTGDVRLLATVSHRGDGEGPPNIAFGPADMTMKRGHRQLEVEYGEGSGKFVVGDPEPEEASGNPLFKRFRTAFDHLLFTVVETPQHKEFINNNAEGVWLKGGARESRK